MRLAETSWKFFCTFRVYGALGDPENGRGDAPSVSVGPVDPMCVRSKLHTNILRENISNILVVTPTRNL